MSGKGKWGDLAPRFGSGILIAVVGLLAIWYGGWPYLAVIALACGLMFWELSRIINPESNSLAVQLGLLAVAALLLAVFLPLFYLAPVLVAPALVGAGRMNRLRGAYAFYSIWILAASYGFLILRDGYGAIWMFWLVLVVSATDIAGYFAGKTLGGPKFWPAISPKKTWSGTIGGWLAAGFVGVLFVVFTAASPRIILFSIVLSFASQIGDISVSALKRKTGIKDASNLIPGHGGLLDRFDGMLGAAIVIVVLSLFSVLPSVDV